VRCVISPELCPGFLFLVGLARPSSRLSALNIPIFPLTGPALCFILLIVGGPPPGWPGHPPFFDITALFLSWPVGAGLLAQGASSNL
jgi:hypothetical protein